ncbi:iron ABC transporter permease [Ramlibacter monticola]|uniref:Iron ABC transporter permease n=1 Tax=Ramlibacter monticola TaxID=1926872 RepID=A0A937CVK6_9BURK|nr:iron ABC transporter permease [Ramlibacter monticola]MBL0393739.1 iron ABC transporter permease [Ramlibacter monticola]
MSEAQRAPGALAVGLAAASAGLLVVGIAVGSMGWEPLLDQSGAGLTILWEIRLPRTLGAWLAGALLGLSGAVAQGLFRNPLADPYLLGSSTGAALGVALLLALLGAAPLATAAWAMSFGMTGAAFAGAVCAVMLTLALARGVQQTLRLLLAGVIVGMVFGALASLVIFLVPELLRSMQSFLLGTTGYLGWASVGVLALVLLACGAVALAWGRALDALALGETTASSLGVPLARARLGLVGVIALGTGAAVAHVGLVAFIGLMAPHLVRALAKPTHRWLLPLSGLAGGTLLLAADVLARWLLAPRELPVGVVTAVLGGGYLLALMQRRPQ